MSGEGGLRVHDERERGWVVTVCGGKGGTGCTLVAAGLAAVWRRRGRAVSLFPLGGGSADELELLFPDGPLSFHPQPSDPAALPSPASAGERVVLDCSWRGEESERRAVLGADVVLVVATPDLLGLRGLVRSRRRVLTWGLEPPRIGVVLNRVGIPGGLSAEKARKAVGVEFWGTLPEAPEEVERLITRGLPGCGEEPWMNALAGLAVRVEEALSALPALPRPTAASGGWPPAASPFSATAKQEAMQKLVHRLGGVDRGGDPAVLRRRVTEAAASVVVELADAYHLPRRDTDGMVAQLVDEVLGFGVLEDLIRDPEVTEVMINGPNRVYVERQGQIKPVPCRFSSPEDITRLVDRIIGPLGRRIDESSPMVDARLPDGSRLNAVIPPLALDGPLVTIRRFGVTGMTMDDLVRNGMLGPELARFLRQAVVAKKNILLSGGAGTGKTTLLNALSGFVPATERVITIEDAAELRLQQEHVVRLEARPPNVEGRGAVSIRDLVRNALRMRPDRIIVGEVRGAEALDMLQAMNTGHSGSLATIHANSARDALSRLETMALMADVALPLKVVREQVSFAIDLVVHLERLSDGRRRVAETLQLQGLAGGRYQARPYPGGEGQEERREAAEG